MFSSLVSMEEFVVCVKSFSVLTINLLSTKGGFQCIPGPLVVEYFPNLKITASSWASTV